MRPANMDLAHEVRLLGAYSRRRHGGKQDGQDSCDA
jgi:hypothetical protein